jgi:hypothetical protein
VLDNKSADTLRAWLHAPTKVKPTTECLSNLDGAEVDAMLTLFTRKRHFVMDKKVRPPAFEARRDPPKYPAPKMEKRR